MLQEPVSPSKIVKVSASEMIAIMRRNSSKSFVPAVLHNNAAGIPILTQALWTYIITWYFILILISSSNSFICTLITYHYRKNCACSTLTVWRLISIEQKSFRHPWRYSHNFLAKTVQMKQFGLKISQIGLRE